jgi:cell volume regulation protein A
VRPLLSELDYGQVEGEPQREELDGNANRDQEDQEHATRMLGHPALGRKRQGPASCTAVKPGLMTVQGVILTVAVMLGAGLVCRLLAGLLSRPHMLVLLVAGIVLGPGAVGAIDVPLDSMGAQVVLTLGVSFILFHGGLQLSGRVLGQVAVGVGLLAVPGVVLTAIVTGLVAAAAFDVPLMTGLLIGAVLAPTDPAILIPLFERLRLRAKISQTIIAESALNDPTGAVLALAIAGVVLGGSASLTEPLVDFLVDLLVSTTIGVFFGVVLAVLVSNRRAGVWGESHAVAVMLIVSAGYFSIDSAGGSGYLGAFLAGLIVGNPGPLRLGMHAHHEAEMRVFVSTVADVMVMFVFLTLGANLPSWDAITGELAPALVVLAALILVARPLAVIACLLPDRRGAWSARELVFLAWTRETGVVPAALAGIIVGMGVPGAQLVVITAALAIVLTLSLQTTTKGWLARRLRLLEPVEPALSSRDRAIARPRA